MLHIVTAKGIPLVFLTACNLPGQAWFWEVILLLVSERDFQMHCHHGNKSDESAGALFDLPLAIMLGNCVSKSKAMACWRRWCL
jgi:hypothetical protein